jgi:hypothetical protein
MRSEVSVINKTGRILWVPNHRAKDLVEKGLAVYFPSPKQDYYPQYDQGLSTYKAKDVNEFKITFPNGKLAESLEVELV